LGCGEINKFPHNSARTIIIKKCKDLYQSCKVKSQVSVTLYKQTEVRNQFMPYTTEEGGRLNNFAREPKIYEAEPPNDGQKRNYILLGIVATVLVASLIFVAFSVSNVA
jgi:hypothetical protein